MKILLFSASLIPSIFACCFVAQARAVDINGTITGYSPFFPSLLSLAPMRKTREGRQHAQKGKARRVQQMTKLRQKAVRRAAPP
jgi:hypothetical protein